MIVIVDGWTWVGIDESDRVARRGQAGPGTTAVVEAELDVAVAGSCVKGGCCGGVSGTSHPVIGGNVTLEGTFPPITGADLRLRRAILERDARDISCMCWSSGVAARVGGRVGERAAGRFTRRPGGKLDGRARPVNGKQGTRGGR